MLKRLPSYISIIAAVIVIIMGFAFAKTPYEIAVRLVVIISVTYVAGLIIRSYFTKKVFPPEEVPEEETPEGETTGEETSDEFGDEFAPFDEEEPDEE
ncbi:hypothetical protein LJB89_03555 [Tyzzerella sp. OttesenSCG-928-J15]|nr:hypothetical protein [Tyzzerella sp. OttesenSCG-928-J15]